ncbi:hypothetical protein NQ317_010523 [Molorchus minor]|uniref:Uncharacterized protein n=1 Tax=Molorchus minor TaxID=1323400 RepID=A0ABQ9IRH8_9CUCU|nr:hypothetical protein NQ317_010523 [Molorchus minor]
MLSSGSVIEHKLINEQVILAGPRGTSAREELNNVFFCIFRYKENIKIVADIIQDQPMTGLEKAVWWTEYVLRHGNTEHLRNPIVDLPLYKYLLLDVLSFFINSHSRPSRCTNFPFHEMAEIVKTFTLSKYTRKTLLEVDIHVMKWEMEHELEIKQF